MIIVFGLLALAVVAALYGYLWRRLVRDTTTGRGWPRRLGTALFIAGPVTMSAALFAELGHAPFPLQRVLAWPGFLWMALSLYLLLAVVAGEALRPLLSRLLKRRDLERPFRGAGNCAPSHDGEQLPPRTEAPLRQLTRTENPAPAPAPTRRLFVSRVVGAAAATAATATVGYGTYGVLRGPRVKRVTVPLAKLPRAAHGYRIAVVSDIHLGPVLGRGFAQRVVDTVNATRPDLIAVVGDLVDGSVQDLGPAAAPLAQLSARHGSYFVTGNHEYFSGARLGVPPGP
ncbi:metallophosphoesterase [Streptomyces sp. 900105755]